MVKTTVYLPDDLGIDFAETVYPGLQNTRVNLRSLDCGHELLLWCAFAARDFEQQLLGGPVIRRRFKRV